MVDFLSVPAEHMKCVVGRRAQFFLKIFEGNNQRLGFSNGAIEPVNSFFVFKRVKKRKNTPWATDVQDFFVSFAIGIVELNGPAFDKDNLTWGITIIKNNLPSRIRTIFGVRKQFFYLCGSETVHMLIVAQLALFV